MSKTIIEKFPAHRLDEARQALERAHGRIVRSATKTGQNAPAAPELHVIAEHVESRCHDCKTTTEGFPPASHLCHGTASDGAWTSLHLVDLELSAARPVLAGWDFLAVIEPLEGGNLLRQVPGAAIAEGELSPWRQGEISCNHCSTSRRRTETFIVRADGSDSAIPAGTYKQVGRNCLEAFLGGKSPASIVAQLAWPDVVRTAGEDGEGGWGGGRSASVFQPEIFLAQTAACIRLDGWVSRSQARADADDFGTGRYVQATADQVCYLLTPPFGGDPRSAWREACLRCRPTDADIDRGVAALTWARGLVPTSDYENNLTLVAKQPTVKLAHAGILASVVAAHGRVLEREIESRRHARTAGHPSQHVGEVGQRLEMELEVQRVNSKDTDYGVTRIISMRDQAGNLIVWMTGSTTATPGDRLNVRGTVKKHNEYQGEKQTVLTRCRAVLIDPNNPLPPTPKKARKSKKSAPRVDEGDGHKGAPAAKQADAHEGTLTTKQDDDHEGAAGAACSTGPDGCCTGCGVMMTSCGMCEGVGYHTAKCPEIEDVKEVKEVKKETARGPALETEVLDLASPQEKIRKQAVENVDRKHHCTWEFSYDPHGHIHEYLIEEERLTAELFADSDRLLCTPAPHPEQTKRP